MALSTRSKFPLPVTCMRSVRGSPAGALVDESSPAILKDPTAPLKFGGRPSVGSSSTVNSSGGLATMGAGRGTFIAYASAPGQAASDNRRGGNGLYTSYLIEALRTPGLELQRVFATAAAGT